MIILRTEPDWLECQQIAGRIAGQCLSLARNLILTQSKLSLKDIERACHDWMTKHDATPTFLNYKGTFPGAICTSVNNQLVHGVPTDYQLESGDVIKIDLGVTYRGAIGDCAMTVIKGEPKHPSHLEMSELCRAALNKAIASVKIGARLGVIGSAIHHTVKSSRFGLVAHYGGHGIQENIPHAPPFVSNKSQPFDGIRIQPGLTLAIEPMLTATSNTRTRVGSDGWTVYTEDVGVHWEHSLFVGEDKIHILTEENEDHI